MNELTTQRIIWQVVYLIGIFLQILLCLFVSNILPFIFSCLSILCVLTSAKLTYDAVTGLQTETRLKNYAAIVEVAEWGGYGFLALGYLAIIYLVL